MARTYADAVTSLNTLQSNFSIVDAIRRSGGKLNENSIPEMIEWCRKIGYEPSKFRSLNAIHIAGTKGKGSTSAFISSIISQYIGVTSGSRPILKVGLFTSPHLRFVRERIQINNEPLTEEQFAHYFFEIWDRLEVSARATGLDPKDASAKPVYFRYLTLMAFHTYMSENVDVAIIECGMGGEYDSTNVLTEPVVTGITSLGIDHVGPLGGGTIEEIAWHKAGIMKHGAECFTSTGQKAGAMRVLEERAREKDVELQVVEVDEDIGSGRTQLGLQAEFQKVNASLAVAISKKWLSKRGIDLSQEVMNTKIKKGLRDVQWGGRCETRREPGVLWCIDGGHTLESIELAGQWFAEQVKAQPKMTSCKPIRVLIFNQQTRQAGALAKVLHDTLAAAMGDEKPFTHAIFCTNKTFKDTGFRPDLIFVNTRADDVEELRVQKELASTWATIDPKTNVEVVRTIEEAVLIVQELAATLQGGEEVTALVTGSLHLVGGFLVVLETGPRPGV